MLARRFAERENQPPSVSGFAFSLASVAVVSVQLVIRTRAKQSDCEGARWAAGAVRDCRMQSAVKALFSR